LGHSTLFELDLNVDNLFNRRAPIDGSNGGVANRFILNSSFSDAAEGGRGPIDPPPSIHYHRSTALNLRFLLSPFARPVSSLSARSLGPQPPRPHSDTS